MKDKTFLHLPSHVHHVLGKSTLFPYILPKIVIFQLGAAVAEWLSSWLAEQEDRGSIPGLAT